MEKEKTIEQIKAKKTESDQEYLNRLQMWLKIEEAKRGVGPIHFIKQKQETKQWKQ